MTSLTQAIMAASARAAEEEEGFDFHEANDPLGSPRTPRGLWRLAVKTALASREPPNSIVWGGFPFDLQEVKMKRLQALEESNSEVHIGAPGGFSPWSDIVHLIQMLGSSKLNILLLAVPVGIAGGILNWSPSIVFAANFLALLPLALILGELTEDLILRFGETIGGLLNATFGNVVEMILGLAALSHGLMDVVAASLIGSILSNLLLVLGCCFFFGGSRFKTQQFNSAGNKAATSLLFLACISVITPTMASVLYGPDAMAPETLQLLSHCIAVLLVGMYICYLFFQLKTHSESFSTNDLREDHVNSLGRRFSDAEDPTLSASLLDSYEIGPVLSVSGAIAGLTLVTITVAVCSEYLTGAIEAVSEKTHINKSFLGLILLPIAGNAAEHFTAVFLALKNKMDAAISIAVGSSIQIAVFVLPVTVLVGWVIGRPFTLDFDPFAVTILTLSVVLAYFVTSDGKSNWLLGLQLILTYTLISFVYLLKHDIS
ncbi:hypothetical protein M9434_003478 [Picochlorum sp. BPE23]|nr:hypothetical protein M9434_003478 [Picochlorum sp. BPE23]